MTPDGSTLYVPNTLDGTVSIIDLGTQRSTATVSIGYTFQPLAVRFTPDGSSAYVLNASDSAASSTGSVSVITTSVGQVTAQIEVGTRPSGIAITPDGLHAYVVNEQDQTLSAILTKTNAPPKTNPGQSSAAPALSCRSPEQSNPTLWIPSRKNSTGPFRRKIGFGLARSAAHFCPA